jgi:hypothetical protein
MSEYEFLDPRVLNIEGESSPQPPPSPSQPPPSPSPDQPREQVASPTTTPTLAQSHRRQASQTAEQLQGGSKGKRRRVVDNGNDDEDDDDESDSHIGKNREVLELMRSIKDTNVALLSEFRRFLEKSAPAPVPAPIAPTSTPPPIPIDPIASTAAEPQPQPRRMVDTKGVEHPQVFNGDKSRLEHWLHTLERFFRLKLATYCSDSIKVEYSLYRMGNACRDWVDQYERELEKQTPGYQSWDNFKEKVKAR